MLKPIKAIKEKGQRIAEEYRFVSLMTKVIYQEHDLTPSDIEWVYKSRDLCLHLKYLLFLSDLIWYLEAVN